MRLVVFLGYKNGGKTTAIELVTRALVSSGFRVGTIKHVHEATLSMDTPGKDTWRHAQAGASVVVSLAPHELTTIRRGDTRRMTIEEVIKPFKEGRFDFVLVEGLHRRAGSLKGAVRVICAGTVEEARDLVRQYPEARCILGRAAAGRGGESLLGVPLVELPQGSRRLMRIVQGG